MDSKRAKQILQSSESIEVLYNGSPVWLENVKENNTADVTDINSQQKETVPVNLLIERNPVKR